jgi:hypothetical protein
MGGDCKMKTKMKIVPMNAGSRQICELSHDNVEVGDFSIMTDAYSVWLSEQKLGEDRTQHISIPRPVFNKLIRWYTEGIVPREDKRR